MRNNASLVYSFFLVVGDFLALVAAFAGAYLLRTRLDDRPLHIAGLSGQDYILTLAFLIPFWLIVFALLGLYNKNVFDNRFAEFGRLAVGSFVGMLFLVSYGYVTEEPTFPSRLVTLYALILAFLFLLLFRTIIRAVRRGLFGFGIGVNNVLIVGDTPITREFVESLAKVRISGYRIVGLVGGRRLSREYQHFTSFAGAVKALDTIGVHSIIQTELYSDPARNSEILTYAQENHVAYRFVPGNSEVFAGSIEVDLFNSIPVVAVHQTALVGWGRIVKRLFDIVVGGLLLLLSLPLMAVICLFYLFDGWDPVFRQTRLSRFGAKVKIYKFRTNKHAYNRMSPEQGFAKMGRPELAVAYRENGDFLENDPRISFIGRFLRRTSLDELPQLFNVVKGDISLVGPRPLEPFELEKYDKKSLILSVKTGLTGLAVISGRRDIPFEERRQLDLYYVQHWSFWSDIVILAKTAAIVLLRRGAK